MEEHGFGILEIRDLGTLLSINFYTAETPTASPGEGMRGGGGGGIVQLL